MEDKKESDFSIISLYHQCLPAVLLDKPILNQAANVHYSKDQHPDVRINS